MATSGLLMATPRGLPLPTSGLLMATPAYPPGNRLGCQGRCQAEFCRCLPISTDFYRLSWETSTSISTSLLHDDATILMMISISLPRFHYYFNFNFRLHHNTDDDDQFHYYHYMALIRALEESLRDLA